MTKDLRGTSDTSNIKVKVKFFPALLDKMSLNCCQSWTRTYKLPWTVLFKSPWTMLFESPWTTRKGDRHPKHQTDAMIAWKAINSTSSPSSRLQGASALNTRSKARGYSLRNRNNSTICLFGVARQNNSAKEFRTAPKKSSSKCPSKFGIRSTSSVLRPHLRPPQHPT